MQLVKVPQLAWYGPRDLELPLPDEWQVSMHYMSGYNRPSLESSELEAVIKNPIGTPLREKAADKKEAVIVIDDLTRVTRTAKIVPYIIRELAAGGITDKHIRFICGLGLHAPMTREGFVKKLGEDIVARYRCFNHNPFGNCVLAGTTETFQSEVFINEEYMKCDLKIVITGCVPHPAAGFGGGSKMVFPGLASYQSISWNHGRSGTINYTKLELDTKPVQGMGLVDNNPFKKDVDEAAGIVGIDFLIECIVNLQGETCAIYAGDWRPVQAAAIGEAKTHYITPKVGDKSIVISNNYAKANEATVGLTTAFPIASRNGGDIVLITNSPEGQVIHYLASPFGLTTFAEQHSDIVIPPHINQVIVFSEYPHPGSSWFEENDKIVYISSWDEVLQVLRRRHGVGATVAVLPDATNQYFAW